MLSPAPAIVGLFEQVFEPNIPTKKTFRENLLSRAALCPCVQFMRLTLKYGILAREA